jgi:hypothetical protein
MWLKAGGAVGPSQSKEVDQNGDNIICRLLPRKRRRNNYRRRVHVDQAFCAIQRGSLALEVVTTVRSIIVCFDNLSCQSDYKRTANVGPRMHPIYLRALIGGTVESPLRLLTSVRHFGGHTTSGTKLQLPSQRSNVRLLVTYPRDPRLCQFSYSTSHS